MRTVAVGTVPSAGVSAGPESDTNEWVPREPLTGLERLLADLPSPESEQAAEILAGSASVEIEPGVPYLRASFPGATLLVVDEGFVVLRDGRFPTLMAVIDHYNSCFGLGLTPQEKSDLVQYLKSL